MMRVTSLSFDGLLVVVASIACSAQTDPGGATGDASAAGGIAGAHDAGWPDAAFDGSGGSSAGDSGSGGPRATCSVPGAIHFALDLSLTSASEIGSELAGAVIGGGSFDTNGWTPLDRAMDILILPLPEKIDTRRGRVRFDVENLDIQPNADCEEFQLISVDYRAEPYSHGAPERARFDLLHLGNDEDCNTGGVYREGRFELGGNLRGCTAADDVPCGVNMLTPTDLAIPAAKYGVEISWNLTDFELKLSRDGAEIFSGMASAQIGELQEDQMYVILNQCAGGSWPRCGLGPTYPAEAGGMSGTTFSNLKVELVCP